MLRLTTINRCTMDVGAITASSVMVSEILFMRRADTYKPSLDILKGMGVLGKKRFVVPASRRVMESNRNNPRILRGKAASNGCSFHRSAWLVNRIAPIPFRLVAKIVWDRGSGETAWDSTNPVSGRRLTEPTLESNRGPLRPDSASRRPPAPESEQQNSQDHRGGGDSLSYSYAGRLEPKLDSVFAGRRYNALKHQIRQ